LEPPVISTRILPALSILALVLSGGAIALAQATTSLNGRITDRTDAVIAGAAVRLTLTSTGAVRENTTDVSGQYQFSQLAPGKYTLVISAPGFATAARTNMDLLVSQPATVNVTLRLAGVTQEVTVNVATQELLNTTDATLGNAFDSQQVVTLPLAQRNIPDLLSQIHNQLNSRITDRLFGRGDSRYSPRISSQWQS
jgi:hypothetical protein